MAGDSCYEMLHTFNYLYVRLIACGTNFQQFLMHRYFRAVRSNTLPPSVPAGCAKLRGSRDWFPAGLYMPFGRPQNAIRSSCRENVGNRGQDLIFQIKSCCRRRRECIGIRANCGKYLYSPHFLCYCFLSSDAGIQTAYTAPPETSPDSPSASLPTKQFISCRQTYECDQQSDCVGQCQHDEHSYCKPE